MKFQKLLLVCVSLFLISCNQQANPENASNIDKQESPSQPTASGETTIEKLKFKNMAFCNCLHQAKPDSAFWKNEGSAGGYIETGQFGVEHIELADSLAKIYLQKDYPSCCGSKLFLMKCLDFYNCPELDAIANTIVLSESGN